MHLIFHKFSIVISLDLCKKCVFQQFHQSKWLKEKTGMNEHVFIP